MKKIVLFCIAILAISCTGTTIPTQLNKPIDLSGDFELIDQDYTFTLSHDFSNKFEVEYEFRTEEKSFNTNKEMESETTSKSEANGILKIRSLGTGDADLVYEDVYLKSEINMDINMTDEKNEPQAMEQGPLDFVHQGYKSDGTVPSNPNLEFQIKTQFPILNQELSLGKKAETEYNVPFNYYGSMLLFKGRIQMEVLGFVKIQNRIAAKLKLDYLVDDTNVPQELKQNISFNYSGTGIFYFDINQSVYIYGSLNSIMLMHTEYEAPDTDGQVSDSWQMMSQTKDINTESAMMFQLASE